MKQQISKKILFLGYDQSETVLINFLSSKNFDVFHSKDRTADIFSASKNFDFLDFALVISFGYRHIIPKSLIEKSPPIINLHISMLPYNRGTHPIFWSAYECTPSGVSIHSIDEGIDTGPLLYQKEVYIDQKKSTFTEAHQILRQELENLFITNFNQIAAGKYPQRRYTSQGTYHNSCDLPKDFLGWDMNISSEINRLKKNLFYREADKNDCEDIFNWRNDETTRSMSLSSEFLDYKNHKAWFNKTLNNPREICLFFEDRLINLKVGIVRFQLYEDMKSGLISINLSPESRGKNYAKSCLFNAINFLKLNFKSCKELDAEIKYTNIPSLRTFEGMNFKSIKKTDELFLYKLVL